VSEAATETPQEAPQEEAPQEGAPPSYPAASEVFQSGSFFARETEELFREGWVFVGTLDQLPEPRSWFTYEAAGRSLIVARDKEGQLGAFVNACSHRGTRLCEGQGHGRLQCPYHGWVFDTDGSLMGPSRRKGLPQAFRNEDHGLAPVRLEQVGAFLFACEGSEAPPLREVLGERVAYLEAVSQDLGCEVFEVRMEIEGNWKLVVSGAIEDYHVPFVHGQSLDPSRTTAAEPTLNSGGHSSFITPAPIPPGLTTLMKLFAKAEPKRSLENALVFPNLLLVQIWTLTHVTTFVPLGPDRTLRVSRLFDMAPNRPWWTPLGFLHRFLRPLGYRGVFGVYEEDRVIVEEAQRGCAGATHLTRPPAHAEERRVEHFLQEAARRLGFAYAVEELEDPEPKPPA